ncbi:FAD/NAD(P)-binding protein [Pseudoduganella violacea]|uniref:Putative NAD(P)/FAD-binding protein YdhS n=1 Tax=Pseudoduganella violacea TaxID=1715466 RepID=A0A7W5BC10_9BURK|nr:FAD/NAD(P)-binding protein [Pseudoduganella violacea]MBB3120358.1 putative NAD(P)/FAD-binding protein YdhS [Pseudoduganella violacea]
MRTVLIVGAGFSGVACAVQLLRQAAGSPRAALRILLLNRSPGMARGLAYGTSSAGHLLNIPAGVMSALDDDPGHFLRYAQARDSRIGAASFVPRKLYGDYLEWLLRQSEEAAPPLVRLERIAAQAEALGVDDDGATVRLAGGVALRAERVVLAFGHFPSADPRVADMGFYASARYQRDPWNSAQLDSLRPEEPVLLLGSGLTAVDVALSLLQRNPTRRIEMVSRHGLLPQAHRRLAPPPAGSAVTGTLLPAIWGQAATVRAQLHGLRQHARALQAAGHDWRAALAALRPHTPAIWQAWDSTQRRRFLRHVQPYWDSHRHRMAPEVAQRLQAALGSGILRVHAARLLGYGEDAESVRVRLQPRSGHGDASALTLRVARVINCTGPAGPAACGNALVGQLLAAGLLRTDALGLGIEVGPGCAVRDAAGRCSTVLHYIGPWLKADYWEAIAVPELRRFARQIAQDCLKKS